MEQISGFVKYHAILYSTFMNSTLFFKIIVFAFLLIPGIVNATTATPLPLPKGAPFVSPISPRTAIRDEDIHLSVRVIDNEVLTSCELFVAGQPVKFMTVKRDVAYTKHTFKTNGTFSVYAKCIDTDKIGVNGKEVTVTVTGGSSHAQAGDLIKSGCVGDVHPNDPCTAVYYYGADGRRHAFAQERIFKSWYENFDNLVILSSKAMAEIPLGRNVTYRPGARLIQFTGSTVYAISYAGLLRPIANGQIAESLYGKDWTKLIQGVDDVYYGNYRVGATIESTNDFNWEFARDQVKSIDEVIF